MVKGVSAYEKTFYSTFNRCNGVHFGCLHHYNKSGDDGDYDRDYAGDYGGYHDGNYAGDHRHYDTIIVISSKS